ncbi:PREDICTED: formin-like protein 1 [Amphimedon queenslandica]|uniref:Uncharacterized protein n=1 Tax=Amphimedon queenslandica TaxID=400682 RepID=A0AAN0JSE9_AMPQE|nr:PREDICTED: formin-like protein 1 [Amphimedon queenslandica]|eukprot:XP_019859950.1 PREDICTED: formin-like protein 1 [Amphimedon queenslandica]
MASQVCSLCGETVTGNMQVHLMSKCQGGDRNSEDEGSSSLSPPPSLSSSKTVNVRFLFKPLTNLSFKTVTLLSSFSIDLISNGMTYTSDYTQLPVGDYDGQLIIGSSVCYAVKKFVIDTSGETIPLELDLKQMDTDEKSSGSYTTEGSTIPVTDQTISMTFNPSYTTAVCNNPFCKVHGKARGYTNAYTYDSYGNGVYDDGSYGDEVYEGEGGQRKVLLVYYKYGEGEEGLYPATTDYQTATPTSYKSAPPTSYKPLPGKQRVTSNSPPTSDGETTPTKSTAESEDVSPVKRKQEKHQRSESPPPSHSPPPPLSPATTPPPSPPPSSPPPPLPTASKTPSSSRTQPASRTQSSLINNPKPSPPPPPVSTTPPVHEVTGLSANKTSSTGYTSSPPTHSNEPTTGFHVADIKSPAEDVSALKEENKRLKENMERAKALWEGQRRRLEQRLAQLGGGGGAKSTSVSDGWG